MKVGDRVEHEGFGVGVVKEVNETNTVVDFDKFEITFEHAQAEATLKVV